MPNVKRERMGKKMCRPSRQGDACRKADHPWLNAALFRDDFVEGAPLDDPEESVAVELAAIRQGEASEKLGGRRQSADLAERRCVGIVFAGNRTTGLL